MWPLQFVNKNIHLPIGTVVWTIAPLMCVFTQGHYNGFRKWEQNGGRIQTLEIRPHLQSEDIMTDTFGAMYQ